MWYMLFGLGLWLLCGYIGVAWFHKYLKEECGCDDADVERRIPKVYILTGPTALAATVLTIRHFRKGE